MSVILFDIDNTLLDTKVVVNQGFKPALQRRLKLEDHVFEDANQVYWQTLADSTDFNPQEYAQFLARRFSANSAELEKLLLSAEWFEAAVFPDVHQVLTQLKTAHTLGIFSQGLVSYQQAKLQLSGLAGYFSPEHTYITRRKLDPVFLSMLPESTLIDDRLAVIECLESQPRFTLIWLNPVQENTRKKRRQIQTLSELLQ